MSEPGCPARRWRGALADALLLLFVAALGVKAVAGGAACREIDTWDEFMYYMLPASASGAYEPPVDFSPLYVSWYALLLRTGLPRDEVLSLNWGLLGALVPVSLYVLARAMGAARAAALAVGGGLLATKLIDVWPYPTHFATVILALGGAAAALAARRRRVPWATALVGLTLLTATYARPEFLYSVYLFVPLVVSGAAWALFRRPAVRRSVPAAACVFAGGAALLVWAFGSPVSDGTRLPVALGEHYARNRVLTGGAWGEFLDWRRAWRNDFGDAESLRVAWRNNRGALLWHVGVNARRLPVALVEAADPWVDLAPLRFVHAYPMIPVRFPHRHLALVLIVRTLVLVAVALGLWGAARALGAGHRGLFVGAALFALVAAPALAASLVVCPRYHYLIPPVVFAAALAAAGAGHVPVPERWRGAARLMRVLALPALAVALAVVVPNRVDGWCVQKLLPVPAGQSAIVYPPTPLRDTVRTLREVCAQEEAAVLTPSHAIPFYAGVPRLDPSTGPAGAGFLDCVKSTAARVVLIDPYLTAAVPQWTDDPDLRALREGKETAAFRLVPVRGAPGYYVGVRRAPPAE